jgi:hypothetical protein
VRKLAFFPRLLMFLALLGLGVAGGSFSHADELAPAAVEHLHHAAAGHSHNGSGCCETETKETVHCGASVIVATMKCGLAVPRSATLRPSWTVHRHRGIDASVEPPPPRAVLA